MKFSSLKRSIEIFEKYDIKDDWFDFDHDVIYGPGLDTPFSPEDQGELQEIGWNPSYEYDCWYS
jgi:hypothetical protein